MQFPRFRSIAVPTMATIALAAAGMGRAQTASCEDLSSSVCDAAGFTFELIDHQPAAESNSGSSTWTYEVCVNSSVCALPVQFHDLSHFNIVLPELTGAGGCVSEDHEITLTQTGGFAAAGLSCTGSTQDKPCGQTQVAKCHVDSGELDDGECVQVELTIAGEEVTVGPGAVSVTSKAATNCVTAQFSAHRARFAKERPPRIRGTNVSRVRLVSGELIRISPTTICPSRFALRT